MKKKTLRYKLLAAVLAAGCFCCTAGLSVSAAVTVDDIANKARELGFSEAEVQQGYNYWETGKYTQEHLDKAWAKLLEFEKQSGEMFDSIFESTGTESPTEQTGTGSVDSSTDSQASTEATESVGTKEFINMTLEEKITYVNSLRPEDKEKFLKNLSPEERRSIIKQMSIADKAEIMEGYVDFAETMGMHMTVDEISDDNISVTIRNEDGVIIDKSAVGITIDETGVSHTKLLAAAAAGVILALSGFAFLYRCICRSDDRVQ